MEKKKETSILIIVREKKEEIYPRLLWCGGEDKKWLKKANEGIHQCEGSS